jgi:hypothetical protein
MPFSGFYDGTIKSSYASQMTKANKIFSGPHLKACSRCDVKTSAPNLLKHSPVSDDLCILIGARSHCVPSLLL